MRSWIGYILGVAVTTFALAAVGLSQNQTAAVAGFCLVLFGAIIFWKYRVAFALIGVAMLLTFGLLDVPHLLEFAGLDIILFLMAMMTLVGYLEEKEFFEHLIDKLLIMVGPHPKRIMIILMIAAAVSAALVDEVTSILFMSSAMLSIIGKHDINPIPFIMMLVFTTNIGSSATVVGNPVGVIIALRSGLGFMDFLRWATPISIVGLCMVIPMCMWLFRKDIKKLEPILSGRKGEKELQRVIALDRSTKRTIRTCSLLFGGTILGLIFHHQIEHALHIEKNTMLLAVALLGAGIALLLSGDGARKLMEERVDWWTLSFFMLLFASVGTLKYTGVTSVFAERLIALANGSVPVLLTIFAWASGVLTAVMDNVLAVATFVPIIADAKAAGIHDFPLWWAMLFGATFMGNATLIGSTANIVAVGFLERRKKPSPTFGQWLIPGLIVSIPTLIVANILLWLQLPLMPH